ncbi:uncharacterized protein A1O5_12354 [Cladophialophora psammophila CBS 110553]|uniref:Uncharacterized protein n=1 Tax=Cladophialophora psammophila CBS 110553 TaxID=1182543 RepID=W9VZV6_9EURO|nr:uncharacterized protein A1O5_12354 [Cladophialophora psammophila CBS 110553]EXJ57796.1 hypothetical protein A1O5_12354 [Cladophialophora psammophila CBS 110553]
MEDGDEIPVNENQRLEEVSGDYRVPDTAQDMVHTGEQDPAQSQMLTWIMINLRQMFISCGTRGYAN